jgi:pimeloyl-ACP methyl ester carboxylesterase
MPMERYLTTKDGTQLFYVKTKGDKDKPTLVFVHSVGGNWTLWKIEMKFFQRLGFPCLALDLRGHGLSDLLGNDDDYFFPRFSHDLDFLLQHEKIKDFILIGHSFGGGVAINYCGNFPTRLPRIMVLCETAHRYPFMKKHEFNMNPFLAMFLRFIAEHQRFTNMHFPQLREFDLSTDFHRKQRTRLAVFLQALHVTPLRSILTTIDKLQEYSFEHNQDTEKTLGALRMPVLIVGGDHDKTIPVKFQEELHRLIKKSKMKIITGGYHRIPIQKPEELSRLFLDFFEEHKELWFGEKSKKKAVKKKVVKKVKKKVVVRQKKKKA